MYDILHPGQGGAPDGFPNAPAGWTPEEGVKAVAEERIALDDRHWDVVRALQAYFARHDHYVGNVRALYDALEERFHQKGGRRYLFELFPIDPIGQGCRLAGLEPPAGLRESDQS
mgnify:CR=1 FL=1